MFEKTGKKYKIKKIGLIQFVLDPLKAKRKIFLCLVGLIKFPANMKQPDVIVLPEVISHNGRCQFHLQSAIYGAG